MGVLTYLVGKNSHDYLGETVGGKMSYRGVSSEVQREMKIVFPEIGANQFLLWSDWRFTEFWTIEWKVEPRNDECTYLADNSSKQY